MLDAVRELDWSVVRGLVDYGLGHTWFAYTAYFFAEFLILVFPVALFFLWRWPERAARRHGNQKTVVLALLCIVFALAIKTVVSLVFFRERPFVSHPELVALPLHLDSASFPSGHSLFVFAVAGSLWFSRLRRLRWVLLAAACLVGFGRVAVGVHYPTDVLGGALFGLGTAWFLHRESSSLKKYLPDE